MIKLIKFQYALSVVLALASASCVAVEPAPDGISAKAGITPQTHDIVEVDKTSWTGRAREVLINALSLTGVRYQYGGNSPETGFDCSGFVRYVYQEATNLSLPHSARAISQLGKTIPKNDLKPGDLVFFNTMKTAFSHVGIYLGNNRFIHSPSSGGSVRVEDMQTGYWANRFNGAQRIDPDSK